MLRIGRDGGERLGRRAKQVTRTDKQRMVIIEREVEFAPGRVKYTQG